MANSKLRACKKYLRSVAHEEDDGEWLKPVRAMEELKKTMFDGESMIDALRIGE